MEILRGTAVSRRTEVRYFVTIVSQRNTTHEFEVSQAQWLKLRDRPACWISRDENGRVTLIDRL